MAHNEDIDQLLHAVARRIEEAFPGQDNTNLVRAMFKIGQTLRLVEQAEASLRIGATGAPSAGLQEAVEALRKARSLKEEAIRDLKREGDSG